MAPKKKPTEKSVIKDVKVNVEVEAVEQKFDYKSLVQHWFAGGLLTVLLAALENFDIIQSYIALHLDGAWLVLVTAILAPVLKKAIMALVNYFMSKKT